MHKFIVMKKNNLLTTVSIFLFILGISNLIRIFYGWNVIINKSEIPMWTSFIGAAIPLYLAKEILKLRK
jgi:hypothetical protein|tara:strand:+ start:154 stop:360 length:207 start_codon:yes stop_codon:yes gene_type:complete